jgi:hypothetical protein
MRGHGITHTKDHTQPTLTPHRHRSRSRVTTNQDQTSERNLLCCTKKRNPVRAPWGRSGGLDGCQMIRNGESWRWRFWPMPMPMGRHLAEPPASGSAITCPACGIPVLGLPVVSGSCARCARMTCSCRLRISTHHRIGSRVILRSGTGF